MTKKHVLSWLFMALLCLPAFAQIQDPVKFKTEWNALSDNEAEIIFTCLLYTSDAADERH